VNVTVVDKIPPSIVEDETDPFVVKGLPHDMVVEVIDNVGIGEVHLVYWYGSSIPVNISMGDSSNPVFSLDVPRHPDGSLSYYYDVRDTSWNWYRTRTYMLPVVNVPPELNEIEEWEVTEGITETLDMSKYIIDLNDPVESLTLTARPNVEVEGLVLTLIHNEAIEGYELMISVSDGEDTSEFILNVIVVNVNDMPIITLIEPIDGMVYKTKEPITFHVLAEDEDGDDLIYSWFDGDTPIASNSTFTVSDLSPGNHLITIIVDDGTDQDSRTFNILVKGKKDDESPGFGATVTIMVILFVLMLTIIDMGRKRT
jgi:hypothetical protein